MITIFSNIGFQKVFSSEKFNLPIRWNNKDFVETLEELFRDYEKSVLKKVDIGDYQKNEINSVCRLIIKVVKTYLAGFPSDAFNIFCLMMTILKKTPLKTYTKSVKEYFDFTSYKDPLSLYRITTVSDNTPYERSRVFHTPYYLRSKVSTSRYSIAGYPSLYLGTSLELCSEEVNYNPHETIALAARFQLERCFEKNDTLIEVIELAIKPQDFIIKENNKSNNRILPSEIINDSSVQNAYLLWYPLIASCSFIRVNKKDPFAVEYIIPQLLMQWVRKEMELIEKRTENRINRLIGIRYFSCASMRASEMGFNYVFPTSGKQTYFDYCPVLKNAFKLTKPYYLHEFEDLNKCEEVLRNDNNVNYI